MNKATCRGVLQGIAQKIEDNTGKFLLVGHNIGRRREMCGIQLQLYLLTLCRHGKVARPLLQGLWQIETAQTQFHFAVLYLTEVEYRAYQLLQRQRIALHHLQKFPAPTLDGTIIKQHLHRVGDKGKRSA